MWDAMVVKGKKKKRKTRKKLREKERSTLSRAKGKH